MKVHAGLTTLLSVVTIALGAALVVRTVAEGGGQVGVIVGLLFLAAGAGRLYLARRGTR
jgi:hypothetical protein